MFLLNLYQLTGAGTSSTSITDLQQGPAASQTEGNFVEALERIGALELVPPIVSGAAVGDQGEIQYNDGGDFGASSSFIYDKTTNTLTIENVKVSRLKNAAGALVVETGGTGLAPTIGFFGAIPKARPLAYTKTYSIASRVIPNATFIPLVTTAATNVTPYGFSTAAQADAIAVKVNQLASDVLILKQLIVSLVDDASDTLGLGLNAT